MTRFEHQKASKIAPKNHVRKGYTHKNRGRFGGGAAWRIRTPRGEEHALRAMVTATCHGPARGVQLRR